MATALAEPVAPRGAPGRLVRAACLAASAAAVACLLPASLARAQGPVGSPSANTPSAANAAGSAGSASDDFPRRRAGLWEIETVGAHAAGLPPARYCIDDGTDRAGLHLDRSSGTKGSCTLGAFRRTGDAWSAESVCRQGRTSVVSRSIASGDFDTAYRIDTVVQYDPPLGGVVPREATAIRGRWVGPCLPGQRAGDVSIPGMGRLNMKDGSVVPDDAPEQRKATKPRRAPPRAADG